MKQHIVTLCDSKTLDCLSSLLNKRVKITIQDRTGNNGIPYEYISYIGTFIEYEINTPKPKQSDVIKHEVYDDKPFYVFTSADSAPRAINPIVGSCSGTSSYIFGPIKIPHYNEDTIISYLIEDFLGTVTLVITYYDQIFIEELSDNPNDFGSSI
jgi:hypothetical protein